MSRILALDLGTSTGWAIGQDGVLVDCGTWKLATPKEIALADKSRMNRRLDPRIPTLYAHLINVWDDDSKLDWVVWEDVQFSSTTMQTQLWSSFRTAVWLFSDQYVVQSECLGVSKLKQFATGHGGATKELMAAALVRASPKEFVFDRQKSVLYLPPEPTKILDDNAVDAVHLLYWAIATLKNA